MENLLSSRLQVIRRALWLLAAALAAFLWLSSCDDMPTERNKKMVAMVGDTVEHLSFLDLEEQPVSLEDLKDKPIILNVWATWCTPCVKEMPALDALAASNKYHVIAVSTDKDSATAATFIKEHGLTNLTVWWDQNGAVSRKELMASSLPITYIIDKNRVLRSIERGEKEWNTMHNQIDKLTQVKK